MMPVHMTEYTIGMDLGGTNLRAAAIDQAGTLLEKVAGATKFVEGREAVIGDIVAAISKLRETHGAEGLRGIGVGVPGFIRIKEGLITNSNNLPYLENVPIRDVLSAKLNTRVILENDANAAALGECWIGAGRDVDDLVLLTLGTGIGGGIISGGRIVRGSVGMAGELGHISVVPNGNPCGCGNQGCLEKHASATAVSAMARLMQLGEDLTSKDVYELAKQDTEAGEKARRVWQVVGEALGMAMASLINTFNFPLYLLSGGMLPAWEYFAPHMMRVAMQRSFTFRATAKETRIAQATLGNLAGLYGAAYLPWVEK
jgi:glucokinase